MDIIKPPPARQLQALRGGWGIVADDVMSSLYALAVNHAIWRVARSFQN
jgi:phosphatidylglycerophosphatase A